MDFEEPEHLAAVRTEARAWLEANWPAFEREYPDPGKPDPERARTWHRRVAAAGWGAPSWPVEFGGKGYGPLESTIWGEEKSRIGATLWFNGVGFGMAGPTIIAHGTEEQKARYLPPLLNGDEIWCQLFSEPGAGSDLASLSTRAEREGDEWIVNGQKVWSSLAHQAQFGLLLARHDFDVPKHKGLIYLIVDMAAPGVEVRPLKQMDGNAHFNEVFLNDVRVPHADRLGEPGDGWRIAITTLMHERMSIGSASGGYTFPFEKLVAIARERSAGGIDPLIRDALARVYTQGRILELLNARILAKIGRGQIPDAEGSIAKLVVANLVGQSAAVGMQMLGPDGTVMGDEGVQRAFLGWPAFRLGGGTDEIQRNLIGERVLGLPRDPNPDKDVPFGSLRR
ncbi:MAG TPA: acyl-CoA dehydrogenase family protein [Actinomycetota bacterium]|nr:acyl-CoA dehydrogenase family protein [Actinomycetota bacterium]